MGQLLARIYRKFFWRSYDNIGRLLVLNALWFAIFPVPTYLCFRLVPLKGIASIGVTLLVGLLTASYAGAGVFAMTARIARRDELGGGTGGQSAGPNAAESRDPSVAPSGSGAGPGLAPRGGAASSSPGESPTSHGATASSPSATPSGGLLRGFFTLAWGYFPRMALLNLLFGGAIALLFQSIRFYSGFKVGGGILGFFLAGIQIWILAFCLLMQVYAFPLLYLKDLGIRRILKWSAVLVVLRPGLTVLIFIQAFAMFGLLAFTGVGLVLLAYSLVAVFLNVALLEILRDMEDKWTAKKKPTSWREIMAERDADQDDRRTLKDILRPWD